MRVPVLTYHSNNILGNDYADNDHVALADDLRRLHRRGLRVVPLAQVVAALDGDGADALDGTVALSFDDGSWFDWFDMPHPSCGLQRGFAAATGAAMHATCFVIVSPAARAELDVTCLAGRGWWDDGWWRAAQQEGLLAIESHSWDHNHATLRRSVQRDQARGRFTTIDTWADADAEIRQAADWLDVHLAPHRSRLFAFPYGESNAYLVEDYLPNHVGEHRLRAAFATGAEPLHRHSPRWQLPRYVCGQHWRSGAELERLLDDAR